MTKKQSTKEDKKEVIRCNNLTKSIGDKQIIKGVNFSIYNKGINWIIGKNGSGKSTLIRIITGLLEKDSGELLYNCESTFAVLLESECLDTRMTGINNIEFFLEIKGQNLDKSLLEYYGIKFGIYDDLNRNVAEYSKGMKRKLSILIVMLCDANIIILDEPFSGLDKETRDELIKELRNDIRTVIIIEHDLTKFENVDNFIIMENGLVINADKNV